MRQTVGRLRLPAPLRQRADHGVRWLRRVGRPCHLARPPLLRLAARSDMYCMVSSSPRVARSTRASTRRTTATGPSTSGQDRSPRRSAPAKAQGERRRAERGSPCRLWWPRVASRAAAYHGQGSQATCTQTRSTHKRPPRTRHTRQPDAKESHALIRCVPWQ